MFYTFIAWFYAVTIKWIRWWVEAQKIIIIVPGVKNCWERMTKFIKIWMQLQFHHEWSTFKQNDKSWKFLLRKSRELVKVWSQKRGINKTKSGIIKNGHVIRLWDLNYEIWGREKKVAIVFHSLYFCFVSWNVPLTFCNDDYCFIYQ